MTFDFWYDMTKKRLQKEDIPTTYLEKVFNLHFKQKAWLLETFGLSEKNDWRLKFDLPSTLEFRPHAQKLYAMIETLSDGRYSLFDANFFRKCGSSNNVKVTKVFKELWPKIRRRALTRDADEFSFDEYYSLINLFRLAGVHVKDKGHGEDPTKFLPVSGGSELTEENAINRLLVWIGEYTAAGRTAVVSLNPYDFITASDHRNCGYSSCLSLDGEYFNTTIVYLCANCVMMMYVASPDKIDTKMGRCWMYCNENRLYQGRPYGTIGEPDCAYVRHLMQDMLGGTWVKRKDSLGTEDVWRDVDTGYIDYGYGVYTYRRGVEYARFTISDGICLYCGDGMEGHGSGGTCECCDRSGSCCSCCDERFDDDDLWSIGGDLYCESCRDERFIWCAYCEEWRDEDDAYETGNGDLVCDNCLSSHYVLCEHCDKYWLNSDMYTVGELNLCHHCIDKYFECTECGEGFKTDCAHDLSGNDYCEDCYKKLIAEREEEGND